MTVTELVKTCSRCRLSLQVVNFFKKSDRPDGPTSACRACTVAQQRARKQERPERYREIAAGRSVGNVLPACGPCNSSKNSRMFTEWRRDRMSNELAQEMRKRG